MIKLNPGLQNFGNTCFANSMIQGLSSCTHLVRYLLKNKYSSQLPEELIVFNNLFLHLILGIQGNNKTMVIDEALKNFINYLHYEENFDFQNQ